MPPLTLPHVCPVIAAKTTNAIIIIATRIIAGT